MPGPLPDLHPLQDGDVLRLGGRDLRVVHVPGHTPGSIVLFDEKTATLLTGDAVARRMLLGVSAPVDMGDLARRLEGLKALPFEVMYSAHDRCGLPRWYLDDVVYHLRDDVPKARERIALPGVGEFGYYRHGREDQLGYFDCAWKLGTCCADGRDRGTDPTARLA